MRARPILLTRPVTPSPLAGEGGVGVLPEGSPRQPAMTKAPPARYSSVQP